jgi:hypothetical protein
MTDSTIFAKYANRPSFKKETYFRGFVEFQRCMNLYYYECLNVPYLVQNGADSVWDAYQTLSIYLQQHFVCGAGFGGKNIILLNKVLTH